jgi:4-amino-4-deoxy-L-arabinose transferase-like glycosyltransferase
MLKIKGEPWLLALAGFGVSAGMLLLLGKAPLYLEEPRRAIIAMEMACSGNYWAPTLFGEWYYNKPPVFNWLLLVFEGLGRMLGDSPFHEFWLRLPTVGSVLAIAGLIYWAGQKAVHRLFGARAALLFLTSGGILLFFSILAEIDLFYALLVFAGMLSTWHFGRQQAYFALFLSAYTFCALGLLTKGLPSLPFTAITLLVYFADQRRIAKLFSLAHILGILLLGVLAGAYIFEYSRHHSPEYLLRNLVGESLRRTPAHTPLLSLPRHIIFFPLNILADMLPGALAGLLLLRRDVRNVLLERHPFIRFCTLMLLANLLLYWISPGTRIRYVYPLFPFISILLAWAWELRAEAPVWANAWMQRIIGGMFVVAGILAFTLIFFEDLHFLPYLAPLAVGSAMAFWILWWIRRRNPGYSLALLFVAMALGRLLFDLIVLPQRAHISGAQRDKDLAAQIYRLTGDRPLYLYGEDKVVSYSTCFYLNQQRKRPVVLQDQLQEGQYYLLPARMAGPRDSVLLRTYYNNTEKVLVLKRY